MKKIKSSSLNLGSCILHEDCNSKAQGLKTTFGTLFMKDSE